MKTNKDNKLTLNFLTVVIVLIGFTLTNAASAIGQNVGFTTLAQPSASPSPAPSPLNIVKPTASPAPVIVTTPKVVSGPYTPVVEYKTPCQVICCGMTYTITQTCATDDTGLPVTSTKNGKPENITPVLGLCSDSTKSEYLGTASGERCVKILSYNEFAQNSGYSGENDPALDALIHPEKGWWEMGGGLSYGDVLEAKYDDYVQNMSEKNHDYKKFSYEKNLGTVVNDANALENCAIKAKEKIKADFNLDLSTGDLLDNAAKK
jgi:hypothetical protein